VPDKKQLSRAEREKSVMALLLDEEPKNTETAANAAETWAIDDLVPFPDHPFKLYEGERLNDMVRSVKELGVLLPVIVRPLDKDEGTYEILSGHNRVNAAKLAGLTEVPVIIKTGLTDDEAELIVTETNLIQRSFADLTHSQRAIALKRHIDAIRKQGKRNDLLAEIERLSNPHEIKENGTSGLLVPKLEARDKAAEKYGLDARTVSRYKKISFLNRALLNRVDTDEIGLYPAVSISYLSSDEQDELDRLLSETAYKVDMKKAESLREFSEDKKLSHEKMMQILSGELYKKPKPKTAPPLKIKAKVYQKYFDDKYSQTEMEVIVEKALAMYFANTGEKEDSPDNEDRRTA
jgi:ParB family chromosome partitioning protein